MASVTKKQEVIYILEMSKAEAEAVMALCGKVTGSTVTSSRKHTSTVYNALNQAGVDEITVYNKLEGSIKFIDGSK